MASTNSVNPSSCSSPPTTTGSTRIVNTRELMYVSSPRETMTCACTAPSASCMAAG